MLVLPLATMVTRPVEETVAPLGAVLLQVACVVRSWLAPSEYTPVAVNCTVSGTMSDGSTGVRLRLWRSGGFTVSVGEPAIAPTAP